MTGFQIATLVVVAVWLGVLTVAVLVLIRQVALVDLRVGSGRPGGMDDGPEIGTDLPIEVQAVLPRVDHGPAYLLFLAPTCGPCVEIATQLPAHDLQRPVLALFAGDDRMAADFQAILGSDVVPVRDPAATVVAQALQINITPFALQIENGMITGKAHLQSADDLVRLIDAYAVSDAAELAARGGTSNGRR